ncbi:MAG TPA: nucleotidyltransferase domain-containing protein [Armatimonadota bacterium]|nr:nucleotidyltransferase domain-containing protein [Armatimonadota bacterium]HQK94417.1 nucleotidyltransferase domain-containing protein [Armatimonadota bacterium]
MAHGLPVTQEGLRQFCDRHGVRRLSLFGSAVRGELGPESDVDVVVEFRDGVAVTLMLLLDMEEELSKLFGRPVDLLRREAIEASPNYIRRRGILDSLEPLVDA